MRRLALILAPVLALIAVPAAAQQDDRSRLVRFIEEALSDGAARQVRIEGFSGALSASASLDRLSVADADGVWLVLEDARIDWSRGALLRGALEIEELAAERLTLARRPRTDAGPAPEARGLRLPDLPVSVSIGRVAVAEIALGTPVLGQAVTASAEGSLTLVGGAGQAGLALVRTDGQAGRLTLDAGFDNASGILTLDLALAEAADGIAVQLLAIPGAPPIDLALAGRGPLSGFSAEFTLATDRIDRLSGQITSRDDDGGARVFGLDIGGDIRPLLSPAAQAFFGPQTALSGQARRLSDGATEIGALRLETAALQLEGRLMLDADARPESFLLSAKISPPAGEGPLVALPLPGADAALALARVDLGYDRNLGEQITGTASLFGLEAGDLIVPRARATLDGAITRTGAQVAGVSADLALEATGLAHRDPGIAAALGPALTATVGLNWAPGAPLDLAGLEVRTDTARATGAARAHLSDNALDITADLAAELPGLAPFAGLAGRPLSGAASGRIGLSGDALAGVYALDLSAETRDLRLGDPVPPALTAGTARLTARAQRGTGGVTLETLTLDGPALSGAASGRLTSGQSVLRFDLALADAAVLSPALSGRMTAAGTLGRTGDDPWQADVSAAGPGGLGLTATGAVGLPGGTVDLALTGQAPLALANRFIAPRSLLGTAALDLRLNGRPGPGALSGRLSTGDARLALPTLGLSLSPLSAGATLAGGEMDFSATGTATAGGQVAADGTVSLGQASLPGAIELTVNDLALSDPALFRAEIAEARLAVTGPLSGGARISGTAILGPTEIRVPDGGTGTAEPIPPIRHLAETPAQRQTRANAGLLAAAGAGPAFPLDLEVTAPGRIFLRGRGLDAELGGALRLGGTTGDVIPSGQFDLVRGRLDILGRRLTLARGSATLQGSFDPVIRLEAETEAGAYLVRIILEGPASAPEVRFTSEPGLPEDEVLAQLFFGRGIGTLSVIQALQLADAAAGLAGEGSGGIFARLRENFGLDDLDIRTDDSGNTAVRAGRYISENIYTDITVDQAGAGLSLNIDLTPDITARGTVEADGQSSVGVFFERDY